MIAQPAERDVIGSRRGQRDSAFAEREVKATPRRGPVVLDQVK
jgi:hypothetical protein